MKVMVVSAFSFHYTLVSTAEEQGRHDQIGSLYHKFNQTFHVRKE